MNRPPRVCSLESRRQSEMTTLITKFGGEPFVAPSMQEVPLENNTEAIALGSRLLAGEINVMVFLTGVGARALLAAMETTYDREHVIAAVDRCQICCRGPKPVAELKTWPVHVDVKAPEPNTWEDLVRAIDESDVSLTGRHVVIQEYGQPNHDLAAALTERGGIVSSVMVYQWAMPDDVGPLEEAVRGVADGRFDVLLITSAQQIRNTLEVAERLGLEEAFRTGVNGLKLASIGPTATATLQDLGFRVDVEPEHPKMGPLVRAALASESL